MFQRSLLFSVLFIIPLALLSQVPGVKGRWNQASPGVTLPFGEFAETHSVGMELNFARNRIAFRRRDSLHRKRTGFSYGAGLRYFIGKNETIPAGSTYHYPNYTYLHLDGGILLLAGTKSYFRLVTGPALSFYDGSTRFNWGISAEGNFFISTAWWITPVVHMIREPGTAPMLHGGIRAGYQF